MEIQELYTGFLIQLIRAVTSGERLPPELEDLADLTGQDSAMQRQQLKTLIRQGGALQAFADLSLIHI